MNKAGKFIIRLWTIKSEQSPLRPVVAGGQHHTMCRLQNGFEDVCWTAVLTLLTNSVYASITTLGRKAMHTLLPKLCCLNWTCILRGFTNWTRHISCWWIPLDCQGNDTSVINRAWHISNFADKESAATLKISDCNLWFHNNCVFLPLKNCFNVFRWSFLNI